MKYLLVINTPEAETVWNAFRFGSAAVSRGHEVSSGHDAEVEPSAAVEE